VGCRTLPKGLVERTDSLSARNTAKLILQIGKADQKEAAFSDGLYYLFE
jgi:hypothetical protein